MVDITWKIKTLRKAVATAELTVSKPETIEKIKNNQIPKGNVFEFSRAAGLLGIKKTSDLIPDCHPLPIEYANIQHHIEGQTIHIRVEVHTIYRTGVEVEAMHGASIVALTMYDMLKPVDKGIVIGNIRLDSKSGGKSDFKKEVLKELKTAVIVCSDSVSKGEKEDKAGKKIVEKFESMGLSPELYDVLPDELDQIQAKAKQLQAEDYRLIIFTGGTGLSDRDVTPEAIEPLLTKSIEGPMEAARAYGQERTPFSMLSRGVAGFMQDTFVLTFPGSTNAVKEYMDALFPYLFHVFEVEKGFQH